MDENLHTDAIEVWRIVLKTSIFVYKNYHELFICEVCIIVQNKAIYIRNVLVTNLDFSTVRLSFSLAVLIHLSSHNKNLTNFLYHLASLTVVHGFILAVNDSIYSLALHLQVTTIILPLTVVDAC